MNRMSRSLFLIISVFGSVLMFVGCGKKNAGEVTVTFNDPGEKIFPVKVFFQLEKTVDVSGEGDYFMSDFRSAYFTDDYAFILDVRQAVSKVDLKTGDIVAQLHQIGRGPKDYLNAMNLTGDDEHVYLLDLSGKSIHVYDYDLNHQAKFNVEYIPLPSSFTKLEDGFMIMNSAGNDSIGEFVVTDNQGRKKASFLQHEESGMEDDDEMMFFVINIGDYFIPDFHGKVLCHRPQNDELFLYDGKNLSKQVRIKPEDDMLGKPGVYIRQIFSLNGKTLVNYFYGKGACYAYYDNNYNLIAEGLGVNETPFFPVCQVGDRYMTVSMTDAETETEVPGKSVQAQIFIYKAK